MDFLQTAILLIIVSAIFAIPGIIIVLRIPDSGAYKQMEETLSSLQSRNIQTLQRMDELDAKVQWQSTTILNIRRELEEWVRGSLILYDQVLSAKLVPAWVPPRRDTFAITASQLKNMISETFSMDEMLDLAFDLGIREDNLSGTTGGARARSLVSYCERNAILHELVERVRDLRPSHPLWVAEETNGD